MDRNRAAGRAFRRRNGSSGGREGAGDIYAAIDLGTNNCRLLVAEPRGRGFRVIDAYSRIVRLGEGLSRTGRLSDEAMERTIEALKICASKMRRRRVTRLRSVATEACRRAVNGADFLDRALGEAGIALEIISTAEEAELAFRGCAPLLEPEPPHALLFDIGGGSTEVGWVKVAPDRRIEVIASTSLPCGVVTLAEGHGPGPYDAAAYRAMLEEVKAQLLPLERDHAIGRAIAEARVQMLGSSGTVTTLAGIHLELPRYDRAVVDGSYLDFATVRSLSDRLAGMSCAMRATLPCIGTERADLVVAGCAILEAICELWPVGRLRVADRGLREGILFGLIGNEWGTAP